MLKGKFPIDKFKELKTPFYYYDVDLLKETLQVVTTESGKYGYHVHYAIKANANPRLLSIIASAGLVEEKFVRPLQPVSLPIKLYLQE